MPKSTSPNDSQTYDTVAARHDVPVVAIDQDGLFTRVNKTFEDEYGWTADELIGRSVTAIIPPYMRLAHKIGFSRFLATEQATLLGHTLKLDMLYKDGRVVPSEHLIVGDKQGGEWRFAAIIQNVSR
jgi:PAS domain S-box-containing protein